jgi:hypothetical protein
VNGKRYADPKDRKLVGKKLGFRSEMVSDSNVMQHTVPHFTAMLLTAKNCTLATAPACRIVLEHYDDKACTMYACLVHISLMLTAL